MGFGNFWRNEIVGGVAGDILGGLPFVGDIINSQRQREQEQYHRDMDALTREREDTAVQRRAADLRAAGLSPTLAPGNPAQSSSVSGRQAAQVNPQAAGEAVMAVLGAMEGVEKIGLAKAQASQARSASLRNLADTVSISKRLNPDVALTKSQTAINQYDYNQAYNYKSKYVREQNSMLDHAIRAYDVFEPILGQLKPGADGILNSVQSGKALDALQRGMDKMIPSWMKPFDPKPKRGASGKW